jgi:4-amino-4-deoxy-L-arabinose transferase-like glycosyltransferase
MNPGSAARARVARLAMAALALAYVGAHLAWYGSTPMGGYPVLDGREILHMAMAIADGSLPAEPFYRAPLYPALLAIPAWLGLPEPALPDLARLINLAAHLVTTLLVFELARCTWASLPAGVFAGTLYGLYPVAAHFAGDPFDVTFATTLMVGAGYLSVRATEGLGLRLAAAAGTLAALSVLARPNLLLCVPFVVLWPWWCRGDAARRCVLAAASGALGVLMTMGAVNLIQGGEFRVLPWQGSHALWDSNGPNANGLYYQHSGALPELVPGTNPARADAERVYCLAEDCSQGIDRSDFTQYWRELTLSHISSNPAQWLQLLATKAWYAINNYEQYNNKTYWVHKERSPWLRNNPLGFAILLALAVGALVLPGATRATHLHLVMVAAVLAALILYFASARFRVPAVPWLAILAGGWATVVFGSFRDGLSRSSTRRLMLAGVLTAGAGTASAWPVPENLKYGTISEDYALLASAALYANRPDESEGWATQVLARDPSRPLAHALICSARFVQWELSGTTALPAREWLESSLVHCGVSLPATDRSAYIAGFFLLALCRREEAIVELESVATSRLIGAEARSALAALGERPIEASEPQTGRRAPRPPPTGLLALLRSETLAPGARSIVDAAFGRHCVENAASQSPGALDER